MGVNEGVLISYQLLPSIRFHCGSSICAGKLLPPPPPDHQPVGTSLRPGSPAEPQLEPPEEPPPKPSKRLIILAECVWASESERGLVLKELCERMASDQLDRPFWVKQYLISPVAQTVEGGGADCCIQYKIHISTPQREPGKAAAGGTQQVGSSPAPPPLVPGAVSGTTGT